jgi:hypothetical protein
MAAGGAMPNYFIRRIEMFKKSWIVIICCVALAAILCTVTYAEKGEKKCSLPVAVEAAIKALLPNGVVGENSKEEEEIEMFEVKVKDAGKESNVKLAEDGTVVEVESVEAIGDVPAAVAKTFKAQDAKIEKVEKAVEHAQVKIVKLDTPIITYEAKITKNGKEVEIKVAADGSIIKQQAEEKKCDKEKKEKDDDDDKDKDKEKDKD